MLNNACVINEIVPIKNIKKNCLITINLFII